MGVSLLNLVDRSSGLDLGPGLGDIPKSCVAYVFLYLTSPKICNLARLNHAFRGVVSSNSM